MLKKISLVFLLLFALTLVACDSGSKVDYPKRYGIVDVISGEDTKAGLVLTLETDGFGGTIKVEVTIVDGKITAYEVKEHTESTAWGKALIDDGALIQAFIDETDDLDSIVLQDYLDSEAGATITAEALLDIAKAALEHYEEDYK